MTVDGIGWHFDNTATLSYPVSSLSLYKQKKKREMMIEDKS